MPDDIDLIDPITGEVLDTTDVDSLIEAYARIDARDKELYAAKCQIRATIGKMTVGDTKTRRLRGKRSACMVEMPDSNWEQSMLKEAWNAFPALRDEFLRIGTIEVRKREFKKLLATTGPADVETFKKMLRGAEKPPSGLPRITVEKVGETEEPPKAAEESEIW